MLALKRKVISNDINRVKKYKNNINIKLKKDRTKRNTKKYGLEDGINNILHKFNIKREVWHGGKMD